MIGRTYLERGKPVVVLAKWRSQPRFGANGSITLTSGPHNVLIRREDRQRVVRPFRGLRRSA